MGLFDDAKQKVDDAVNSGKEWVDGQGGLDELKNKAEDLAAGAKDAAANIDIPGTDIDDKLKEQLGIGESDGEK